MALVLMQVLTAGFIVGLVNLTDIRWTIEFNNKNFMIMASLLHLPTLVALFYCSEARKRPPFNYGFLAALPVTLGFSLVAFTSRLLLRDVFVAFILYGAVTLALLFYCVFCLDSDQEFRARSGLFITSGLLLLYYGVLNAIFANSQVRVATFMRRCGSQNVSVAGDAIGMGIGDPSDNDLTSYTQLPFAEVVIPAPDGRTELLVGATLENEQVRKVFYVKVMALVLMQVLTTGFIVGLVNLTEICWNIERNRKSFIIMASLLHLLTLVALFYCSEARKRPPFNYAILVALPVTLGFSLVAFTCGILLREVFVAFIFYGAVTLALLFYCVFCLDSELQFRARSGFFITTGLLLVLYVPIAMTSWYINPFTLFYVVFIVLIECATLIYRLHSMTSPDYHNPIHPSDYINGALGLHTDTGYILGKAFKKIKTVANRIFT